MDEIIVRVARTIASRPRLRILSRLARVKEVNPKALAGKLKTPLNAVSLNLRALAVAGLVLRRKSGAWCYYRAESPYAQDTLSGQLTAWLRALLSAPAQPAKSLGLQEVRDGRARADTRLHDTIFDAATAFTDLRRLQILRYLADNGAATTDKLRRELSMSSQAVSRHTRKLRRRGYVQAGKAGGGAMAYELSSEFKTPIHAEMLRIVHAVSHENQSRTS